MTVELPLLNVGALSSTQCNNVRKSLAHHCSIVQEKSHLDWQQFKTSEGLEDELAHGTKDG